MTTAKYALMPETIPYSPHIGWLVGCCAALILQQTYYWCRKNEEKKINFKEGFYWTYLTYKDWSTVLKGFEERTIRRNITMLVEKKLLVVGRYNKKGYDKTNWYRVNLPELKVLLEANPLPTGQIDQTVWSDWPIHQVTVAEPIPEIKEETKEETNLSPNPQTQPTEEDMAKGPSMTTELLAHMKNHGQPVSKPNTAQSLELVFKQVAPKMNDMACIPGFTQQIKGYLGRMSKEWGEDADLVMHAVCSDWIAFAKGVAKELGFKTYPMVPTVEFIHKHRAHALAFLKQSAPVQITAPTKQATQTGIPVLETNQTVTPPKKKLVILKKGTGQPPQTLTPDPAPAPATATNDEDEEMSVEALLAFKSKLGKS